MSPFRQQSGRMFAAGFALLAVTGASVLLLVGGSTGCILGGCTLVGCGPSEIAFISDRGASVDPGECSVSVRLGEEQVDFAVGESEGHGELTGLTVRRSPSGIELEPTGRFSHGPLEVTVTTAKGEARQAIEPKWQTSTPNGDACPPECVSMEAAMIIPLSIVVSRKPPNDLIELSVVVPDDTDPVGCKESSRHFLAPPRRSITLFASKRCGHFAWLRNVTISGTRTPAARWASALFDGTVLAPATVQTLTTCVPTGEAGAEWGYGVSCTTTPVGVLWGHGGGIAGYTSVMLYNPASGAVVVVLANRSEAVLDGLIG